MSKANILIVEDEAIIAKEIKASLENMGYAVTSIVKSGKEAVEKAKQEHPDIILMDIKLEGEMDGIESSELVQNSLDIPVIFLTAYADEEKLDRAKLTLPFGYVLKPFRDRDLRVTIEMALYSAKIDAERKRVEEELRLERDKLKDALAEVKTLSGMLPICANCKKIRDDKGYWTQIEAYIRDHSEAEFSHGICPKCQKKMYSEYYEDDS